MRLLVTVALVLLTAGCGGESGGATVNTGGGASGPPVGVALSPTNAVQAYLDGAKAAFARQDQARLRAVAGGELFAVQSSTLAKLAQQGEHRDRDYALVGTPQVLSNAGIGFTVVAVIRVMRDVAVNASGQTVRTLYPAQSLSLTLAFERGAGGTYQLIEVCPPTGPGQMTGQALPPSAEGSTPQTPGVPPAPPGVPHRPPPSGHVGPEDCDSPSYPF